MVHVWTKIAKPSGTAWTKISKAGEVITIGGDPIGLLLALTYTDSTKVTTAWTKITKASGTTWTKIAKAN